MATEREREWVSNPPRDRPRYWRKPKLTAQQRDVIRQRLRDGDRPMDLAAEYGVTAAWIRQFR